MSDSSMNCGDYEALRASDDPSELEAAAAHAASCPGCRAVAEAQDELERRIGEWAAPEAPPAELEWRLRSIVRRELAARPQGQAADAAASRRWFLAAAASFLLAVAGLTAALWLPRAAGPDRAERLLVAEALEAAERAERDHARAIARLKTAAATTLARSDDPETPAAEAALLLSLRDRLASLDATIAEIESYLEENPANPAARTMLLAAYNDQTEVLRQVMALGDPS